MKILLVEDDNLIGSSIEQALNEHSYVVNWVMDGQSALDTADLETYSLILLDLGLPQRDGLQVLSSLRSHKYNIPVIIITARDSVDDKIGGLDKGADDYLVKPFTIKELEARVRAVLRRSNGKSNNTIGTSELELDTLTKEARYKGKAFRLSQREYSLLYELLIRPGAILSREQLEAKIYGWNEEVSSNAIEVIIHGLRKKTDKDIIKNIRGLGWMIEK